MARGIQSRNVQPMQRLNLPASGQIGHFCSRKRAFQCQYPPVPGQQVRAEREQVRKARQCARGDGIK